MIPGLVVLLDLAYLDHLYDTQVYENLKDIPCLWAVFIGLLYLLGQCCMALCTCVSYLKGGFLIRRQKDRRFLKKEIKVFKKNTRLMNNTSNGMITCGIFVEPQIRFFACDYCQRSCDVHCIPAKWLRSIADHYVCIGGIMRIILYGIKKSQKEF